MALVIVALLNVPSPVVLHSKVVALPPITPARVKVLPAQMVELTPALAVAIGLMVKVIEEVAVVQGPSPSGSLVVMVKITDPVEMSVAPGV